MTNFVVILRTTLGGRLEQDWVTPGVGNWFYSGSKILFMGIFLSQLEKQQAKKQMYF